MLRAFRGFSLIELMIVVAIIALLVAIALPAYGNYRTRSANGACLTEVAGYVILAKAAMHDGVALPATTPARCSAINTASAGTLGVPGTITATAGTPGDASITCSMAATGTCVSSSPSGN